MNPSFSTSHGGSCYCGIASFRFEGAPASVVNCHCGQCRRLSGSVFTTWASVKRPLFELSGHDELARVIVTANVTRYFCKRCGSHVFTEDERSPGIVGIPTGAIDDGESMVPSADYFVDHKAGWLTLEKTTHRFGGETGVEPNPA